MIEMICNFMKFIIVISHVISHNLNQICEPFEKFDNFHVINGLFYNHGHVKLRFSQKINCKWNVTSVLKWAYFYMCLLLMKLNTRTI